MKSLIQFLRKNYLLLSSLLDYLRSPFLLALRVYFFWQLMLTGFGKLNNLGKVSEFFASLNIPFPAANAAIAGFFEAFGGLFLIIGLASRLTAIPIVFFLSVAYLTADFEAVTKIFSDPDKFVKADPFPFLIAALVVLVFGPGKISVDALLKWFSQRSAPYSSR
jgi:putative oxidoreductase